MGRHHRILPIAMRDSIDRHQSFRLVDKFLLAPCRDDWLTPFEESWSAEARSLRAQCWPFGGAKVHCLTIAMPRRAFVAGENVPLSGTFQNGGKAFGFLASL